MAYQPHYELVRHAPAPECEWTLLYAVEMLNVAAAVTGVVVLVDVVAFEAVGSD